MLKKALKNTLIMLFVVLLALSGMSETAHALQPTKQTGTGTYTSSFNGFYSVIGFSMIFGGHTTSLALDDVGYIHESETTSPKYSTGFTVATLTGNERRARGSVQVIMSDGSKKYLNYELRINPANFNRNSLVKGRSLLDNLYLESGVDKDDLDKKLATGGTAWINAIVSVRTGSQTHSVMTAKKLWSDGKANYSVPTRTYTRSDVASAVVFSATSKSVLKGFYDNNFTFPRIDDLAPTHVSDTLTGAAYQNGSDYWVKPNSTLTLTVRQHDAGAGNKYQYLRLMDGSTIINRSVHHFSQTATHKADGITHANIAITAAKRTENTKYGTVEWKIQPKKEGIDYATQVYYQDSLDNTRGYFGLNKNIRADGSAPTLNTYSIANTAYDAGSVRWVKPGTPVTIKINGKDTLSGVDNIYLRLTGNGVDHRFMHDYDDNWNDITSFWNDGTWHYDNNNKHVTFVSGGRESTTAGLAQVAYKVTPNTSGHIYDVQYYLRDKVGNIPSDYASVGEKIGVDGVNPTVSFRNSADSADYTSQGWTKNDATVKLKFSDSLSGYKHSQYAWSTSTATPTSGWSSWSTSSNYNVTQPGNGTWYLHVRAEDNVGNQTTTYKGPYQVDQMLPTFSADPSSGAWKKSAYVVTPTFGDGHSGVQTKQYAWSTSTTAPTTWNTYTSGTITQPSAAIHYLHYKVVDNAGNSKQGYVGPYRYDSTIPTAHGVTVTGARYVDGANHWVKPGDAVNIQTNGFDDESQIYQSYLQLFNPTTDQRVYHQWDQADGHLNEFYPGTSLDIISGTSPYYGWTAQYIFGVKVNSNAISENYKLQSYFRDYAGNNVGYVDSGLYLNIDATDPIVTANVTSKNWSNANATVSLTYKDNESGVASKKYAWSTSTTTPTTWSNYTTAVTESSNGIHYLHYQVTDNVGHTTTGYFGPYKVDRTVPTGTLAQTPTDWTNGNVTLTLTNVADSGGSGVKHIKLPSGDFVTGTSATYTVTSNGTYSFIIYDHAGNATTKSIAVSNIDKTKPTATVTQNPSSWTNGNVTLTISNITDTGGSGYDRTKLPDGSFITGTSTTYTVTANGSYTFTVYDHAGNATVITQNVTTIDKVKPTATIAYNTTAPTNQDVVVTVRGTDSASGVKSILLPNGTTINGPTASYAVAKNGTFTFVVTDHAGNQTSITGKVDNIDKTPPTVSLFTSTEEWTNEPILITVNASDENGIMQITLPNGNVVNSSRATYTVQSNGTFAFRVTDGVGNVTTKSITIENHDSVKPTLNIMEVDRSTNRIDIRMDYGDN